MLLALLLQGKELMDYVVDSRGVHVTRYLPDPTPLKLMTRLKSPTLMRQMDPEAETPILRLDSQELSWRNVARVQLWPEKCYILFYAPAWWLRVPVRCTPYSWNDALFYVRDKLGKKKAVDLPEHLRTQAPKKPAGRQSGSNPVPAAVPSDATPEMLRREAAAREAAEASWAEESEVGSALPWEEPDGSPDSGADVAPEAVVPPEAGEQLAMDLTPEET